MGSLSEEQYKSGSCFQMGAASNADDLSSSVDTFRRGWLLFVVLVWNCSACYRYCRQCLSYQLISDTSVIVITIVNFGSDG